MPDARGTDITPQHLGAGPCRALEFELWNRVMLLHERAHLSKVMATQGAFLSDEDKNAIMHDLTDLDVILSAA